MKKAIQKTFLFLFPVFLLVSVLLISSFGIQTYAEEPTSSMEPSGISTSYARPIFDSFIYEDNQSIPINIAFSSQKSVVAVDYTASGFFVEEELEILNNSVVGTMDYLGTTDTPEITFYLTLETGAKLQATIYAYANGGNIYLNANSLFGAKDIYWAEMLNSGTRTQAEYEYYVLTGTMNIDTSLPPITVEPDIITPPTDSVMSTNIITISGTLQWRDDWGNLHPLYYTKVRIMDADGGVFGLWDVELGTTYTDFNGEYSITVEVNGTCDPYLKIYPEGENTVVKNGAGLEYIIPSEIKTDISSSVTIDKIITMSDETGQAFQISQAVMIASRYVYIIHDSYMSPVTVKYPHNEDSDGCFYRSSKQTIYIADYNVYGRKDVDGNDIDPEELKQYIDSIMLDSYASWDAIQHEYFHHVQSELEIEDNPGGWHGIHTDMYEHYLINHSVIDMVKYSCNNKCAQPTSANAKDSAIKLAYAEGVASFLGAMAQQYFTSSGSLQNIKTVGDFVYTSYNKVTCDYENPNSFDIYETNEGAVAAVLFDVFDLVSEGDYYLALGYQAFWDILTQDEQDEQDEQDNKTLSDFIAYFYQEYPQYISQLGSSLAYHKIGVAPTGHFDNPYYLLPYVWWVPNGSSISPNNFFELVILNHNEQEVLVKSSTSNRYTLTDAEWNMVLTSTEGHFYWMVKAYHDDGYGCVTGPYISEKQKVTLRDVNNVLRINNSFSGEFTDNQEYVWYKFIAPTSGRYFFYTDGGADTYGEIFTAPVYGDSTIGRQESDDNSGGGYNFRIMCELDFAEIVYLRISQNKWGSSSEFVVYANLEQHIHSYSRTISISGNTEMHRCMCDCGLYEDREHSWVSVGDTIHCWECGMTISGEVPGGMIQFIDDEDDTLVITLPPYEPQTEKEEEE